MHRLSISRSLWSISRSRAAAFSALFLSASFFSVCMEAEIASSHSAPISMSFRLSSSSCSSNRIRISQTSP